MPDGIVLRARREDDLAATAAMLNRPAVLAGTLRLPFTPDAFYRDWIKEGPNIHAIVADADGTAVGQVVLSRGVGRRAHVAGIALVVHDAFAGRGIGTALLAAGCDLADNWLGLRRLSLEVYVDNHAAIALYERAGFVREGVLRGESLRDGELVDSLVGRLVPAPPHRSAP